MKQFRLGIAAVAALVAAGFTTGAANAAPITVDLLAGAADSSLVQVQYDPYYYSDSDWRSERWRNREAWRAERLRERDAWRAERLRNRDAWRAERFRERDAWRDWRQARGAQWREERRHYWNGW
jgi:hypothetical protein